jgi:hypothetical protein
MVGKTMSGREVACGKTPDTQDDGLPSARVGEASSAASAPRWRPQQLVEFQLELFVGLGT